MVTLRILEIDVLECQAGAILLPIDGALPAQADAAQIDRSLGRIARAFARRHPDLIDEIESQASFPLAPGRAAAIELPPECRFRVALLLSTLAHDQSQVSETALRAALLGALSDALRLAAELGIAAVATPLLTGGWRIPKATAMAIMLQSLSGARHRIEVSICILGDPDAATALRDLARAVGL